MSTSLRDSRWSRTLNPCRLVKRVGMVFPSTKSARRLSQLCDFISCRDPRLLDRHRELDGSSAGAGCDLLSMTSVTNSNRNPRVGSTLGLRSFPPWVRNRPTGARRRSQLHWLRQKIFLQPALQAGWYPPISLGGMRSLATPRTLHSCDHAASPSLRIILANVSKPRASREVERWWVVYTNLGFAEAIQVE